MVYVVNELVTNVLKHAEPDDNGMRPTSLLVTRVKDGISAIVSDRDPRPPIERVAKDSDESGRGWALVQALCGAVSTGTTTLGKDVWVFIPTDNEAAA
ncbi:hypothetical protein AN218_05760 [Streptomyces nanshensis]|uniref:Histidine kinase/HSP90-like ATPase domain-containing protein n=1 Tax=Streptomyces nanshensis TaxID=518642 RepID=A0A1E7LAL0_9ACTN|nr:hypothetical protein AN218_05760 [Streptomyces nanshensis]